MHAHSPSTALGAKQAALILCLHNPIANTIHVTPHRPKLRPYISSSSPGIAIGHHSNARIHHPEPVTQKTTCTMACVAAYGNPEGLNGLPMCHRWGLPVTDGLAALGWLPTSRSGPPAGACLCRPGCRPQELSCAVCLGHEMVEERQGARMQGSIRCFAGAW